MSDDVKCSNCGTSLEEGHNGPCPKCGGTRKTFSAKVSDGIKFSGSAEVSVVLTFIKRSWKAIVLSAALVIFTGVIGLFHWSGTVIGIVIGLIGIWYLPAPKEKETVRK